mmetsp:Transcript_3379/g.4717  ORF Transcript_3379/g.4717 Transcript_3379/m.4717 type:complete len:263 (+) Transcript_3379:86-874(+)
MNLFYAILILTLLPHLNSLQISERIASVVKQRRSGLTIVLEDVRKENVALIARTAEALGVGTLHCIYSPHMHAHLRGFGELTASSKAAQLSKISRSATDWMRIESYQSVESCVQALRHASFETIVATTPSTPSTDIYEESINNDWALRKTALCFGSEGNGISSELLQAADLWLRIPQRGMSQSLNVAASVAIILAEATRRRDKAGISDSLSDEAQTHLIADVLLLEGGIPPRLHNKAHIKHAMRDYKATFKCEIRHEESNLS